MPKVTEITVSAGRTFNHPYESYSNLRPMVTIKADVLDGEDAGEVAKSLQAQAEGLVEDHKRNMLRSIEELHDLTQRQKEIASLQDQIARAQRQLDSARKMLPPPTQEIFDLDDDPEDADEDDDRVIEF